jgi:very-short-patch-repair endonuclease
MKLKPLTRQMRREPTPAEAVLWGRLRNRQLCGVKFRRQHVIERFVVDFYSAAPGLVIEVDGPIHEYTQEEDGIRQSYLEGLGLRVLRFSNVEVLRETDAVLDVIADAVGGGTSPP